MKVILASRGVLRRRQYGDRDAGAGMKLYGTPLYVYHEIVHNKYVVERFRGSGPCSSRIWARCRPGRICSIPRTASRPRVRRLATDRHLRTIDATCPLVTKVHLEAIRFALAGYTILLIGHEGHDEVIGTMGEAPEAIVLVESPTTSTGSTFGPIRQTGLPDADHAYRSTTPIGSSTG